MQRAPAFFALAACALACAEAPAPSAGVVWRAVTPPTGSLSTASLQRVEIASETRVVLGSQPHRVLRWREPVELGDELRVTNELPPELGASALASVDTWVSVRPLEDPDTGKRRTLAELRRGPREVLRDGPALIDTTEPAVALIPVPPQLRGRKGLLSAMARPLPATSLVTWRAGPVDVPAAATLAFGFGVEEEAWTEGWPPVEFRVTARAEGLGDRLLFRQRLDPARNPQERSWHDASLGLETLAGRSVELVFEAEALTAEPGVTVPRSLAVFADPSIRTPPDARRRSVVLVSLDTLRAKSVSAYGSPRATTPSLDRGVAAAGALVRQAVSPFPFTPPSHMSMLTGLDPCMHGVRDRNGVLPSNQLTLAELLWAAGYRTAAFTENGYVSSGAGFARGFDVYFERRDERHAALGYAEETFRRAGAWLETTDDQPFLLFVHTYEVHGPYEPPADYRALFEDDVRSGASAQQREELRSYEQEVRYTDDLFSDLLATLDRRGLSDRTIVVVTADHGEAFGEHFAVGHGYDAHDESVLVPLLVRAPGLVAPGTVIEEQVGLTDLAPTLLDLVGVPTPAGLAGRSFAALLTGSGSFEERPIVIDTVTPKHRAVRTREYKYIERGDKAPLLHRLGDDPLERRNLSEQEPALLAEAREALVGGRTRCEAWLRTHPPDRFERERLRRAPGWRVNRDEIDAQLRALGYAE